jgi:hypothetical protein
VENEYQYTGGEDGQIYPSVESAVKKEVEWQICEAGKMERYGQQA